MLISARQATQLRNILSAPRPICASAHLRRTGVVSSASLPTRASEQRYAPFTADREGIY
jgi:hypothetical protein